MGAASSFQASQRAAPEHKRELLEALEFLAKHKKIGNTRHDSLAEKPLAEMLMSTGTCTFLATLYKEMYLGIEIGHRESTYQMKYLTNRP